MKLKILIGFFIFFSVCFAQFTLPPGKRTEIFQKIGENYTFQYDTLTGKPKMPGFKGKTVNLIGYVSNIDIKNGKIERFIFYGRREKYEDEEWQKWKFDGRHVRYIYLRDRMRLRKHIKDLYEDNLRLIRLVKKLREENEK